MNTRKERRIAKRQARAIKKLQAKVRRAEDRFNDAEYYLDKWSFGKPPSAVRSMEEDVEEREAELDLARQELDEALAAPTQPDKGGNER